jgi:hypothetical protein
MVSISFIIRIFSKNTKFIDYKRNILSFFISFLPNGTKYSTAKTKKSDSVEKKLAVVLAKRTIIAIFVPQKRTLWINCILNHR